MQRTEKIANYSISRGVIEVKPQRQVLTQIPTSNDSESDTESLASLDTSPYDAWKEFLSTTGPYSYMWTHSYIHAYSDKQAVDSLWNCAKHINRSVWGPRWGKKVCGIHATVVAERHKMSHALRGRLHFHVLTHQPSNQTSEERFSAAATDAAVWLRDASGRSMSAADRTDVRKVWSAEGLAGYLTKDIRTQNWPLGDNIFFMRPTGIEGLVLKLQSSAQLGSMH